MSRRTSIAVVYNFTGDDEYELLRRQVKEGLVDSPTGNMEDLEDISTVKEEIQSIVRALREEGFAVRAVNVRDDFARLLECLTSPKPDIVFNMVEYFNDDALQEDCVAALFDLLRIPYTGSPPMTLAICQRKALTKQILKANGVPTPRYKLVSGEPIPRLSGLRYPLIVKPAWEDASAGVDELSVVDDREHLESRVLKLFREFSQPALIEEFIAGRELGVSVLGTRSPTVLPVEEMDFSTLPPEYRGIISFESKWNPMHEVFHKGELVCPARLSRAVQKRVKMLALRTYQAMGCRDYARIDMRLDDHNRLYVLEVNPNPDLTAGVAFMASAEAAGMSFSQTLRRIVEEALVRGPVEKDASHGKQAALAAKT